MIVLVTGGCVTPGLLIGFGSLVTVNGGGRILGVTQNVDQIAGPVVPVIVVSGADTVYAQTSISVVVTGGMVSVVVCTIDVHPTPGSLHCY